MIVGRWVGLWSSKSTNFLSTLLAMTTPPAPRVHQLEQL